MAQSEPVNLRGDIGCELLSSKRLVKIPNVGSVREEEIGANKFGCLKAKPRVTACLTLGRRSHPGLIWCCDYSDAVY